MSTSKGIPSNKSLTLKAMMKDVVEVGNILTSDLSLSLWHGQPFLFHQKAWGT
jgi:hypothetical protein